nr:hypothetical protein [Clostridiales bacterium]
MKTLLTIVIIALVTLLIGMAVLYFVGRKMQAKQVEQEALMEANKQTVSMLIIDKKKLKLTESGLPQMVIDQSPWYGKLFKVPIVKAKVGPKIVTMMCDAEVFEVLPVKTECKVVISGMYITALKSVRGGSIPA